ITAVSLVLLGASLWLQVPTEPEGEPSELSYRLAQGFAIIAVLLSAMLLAQFLFSSSSAGVQSAATQAGQAEPDPRPPFPAALGSLGLGLGLALVRVRVGWIWISEVCAVVTGQIAMLGLIGHLFGVPELYGSVDWRHVTGMSVHTALAYLLVAAGLMCTRPGRGLMAVLRSSTPGGMMVRRWITLPTIMLFVMGVVYFSLTEAGAMGKAVGSWSLFMTALLVLTAAIWVTAETLNQAGLERDAAQRTLERRVQERTAELKEAYAALHSAKEDLAHANRDLEKTVDERTRHLNETIRSLETVCYNIAHDLRAPNRAIAAFAEVLLAEHAEPLDETARDCLRRISLAARRSDALTMDLLAYGRLGHENLPCTPQSLRKHVEEVLRKLQPEIAEAGGSVEILGPLPEVRANPAALEQVLTNLVTNALKFVARGVRPRIRIRAEDADSFCRILVEDNGIGIPPDQRQHIFGVFQRLHTPEQYPG
ncbi:hypothetical protein EG829_21635, partial [bacterium]|nr:hypothetical protein [bacterium]